MLSEATSSVVIVSAAVIGPVMALPVTVAVFVIVEPVVRGADSLIFASYTQDPATGAWSVTPGVTTLTVTGTI